MIRNPLISLRKNTKGSALIEMSLMLPVLILLMGGMIEFGRALQQYHVATKGVKHAARYLARVVHNGACPPDPTDTSWNSYVADAKKLAQTGTLNSNAPLRLDNWDNSATFNVNVTCVANSPDAVTGIRPLRGQDNLPIITVSTSFTFDKVGTLSVLNIPGLSDLTITATHQQKHIGG